MSDKPQKSKFKWVEKLKNIKHIEIYITIIFVIVLILIFFSSTGNSKSSNNTYSKIDKQSTITTYTDQMESKLEQILSQIQGASNVNVMITLDMSSSIVEDNIIQTSTFPPVKGVVIVAKGVENTAVKMNILKAVQAVIDITSGRIEILSSN